MDFTILLPTHNRPGVLALAIRSVLAQSCTDFELLVVGDGCTDHTGEVVREFGDPRIRWFDLPKGEGFGYANRNIALTGARGRLVAFLGHDNLYFPDHLERMKPHFDDPSVHFAYSRPLWIGDDGLMIPFFANLHVPRVLDRFLHRSNFMPASCVVHRRTSFAEVGYWPEALRHAGDWNLWKAIIAHYGPRCIRLEAAPTCLHFRASWRDPATWAPEPWKYLSSMIAAGADWPAELRLDLAPAQEAGLPQAQVWRIMAGGGAGWLAELRCAVEIARDNLAWAAGRDPLLN